MNKQSKERKKNETVEKQQNEQFSIEIEKCDDNKTK